MRREDRLMPGTGDSKQIGHRNSDMIVSLCLSSVLKAYKLLLRHSFISFSYKKRDY